MENNSKPSKFQRKMKSLFIRLRLLKIWFLKNLVAIIRIGLVILIAFAISGVLDNEGNEIIAKLFTANSTPESLMLASKIEYGISGSVSLAFLLFVLLRRTRSITFEDIKSRELKIAMIQERLYFNENGKLCKRLEAKLNQDLDGDNKVVDEEVKDKVVTETVLESVPRMLGELKDILTVNIEEEPDVVIETAELQQETPESETTKPPKEKKRWFLYRLLHRKTKEIVDAAKSSFTEPELNDSMETKVEKSHWWERKKKEEKQHVEDTVNDVDNVEIIKQEKDTAVIDNIVTNVTNVSKQAVTKTKEVLKDTNTRISSQQKKIQDIISKL